MSFCDSNLYTVVGARCWYNNTIYQAFTVTNALKATVSLNPNQYQIHGPILTQKPAFCMMICEIWYGE